MSYITINTTRTSPSYGVLNHTISEIDDVDDDVYYFYEDLEKLKKSWVNEPHFLPLVILYGTVFLFGIIGNGVVIFSVVGSRSSRSVTFTFMVSLAVADILFLAVVVPHETLRMVLGEWSGGRAYCKISGFTELLTAVASILNLTAVSFERYFVIVMPMQSRRKCTLGNTRKVLIIVWILSLCLSTPALYVKDTQRTTYHNNFTSVTLVFCSDHGLRDHQRIYFAIYQLLIMFVIPTGLMIFCYTVVIYVLWISGRTLVRMTSTTSHISRSMTVREAEPGSSGSSSDATTVTCRCRKLVVRSQRTSSNASVRESILKGRKQVIKMLITVIVVFLICWGPQLIFRILKYSELNIYTQTHFQLQIGLYCLPYVQSCLNPVIYGCMSKSFRQSVVTSFSNTMIVSQCRGRKSPIAELELESKYSNGTVLTRVATVRHSASS